MKLEEDIAPADLIMGCGCGNLEIPKYCAKLYQQGFGKKILFAGGLGKITKEKWAKTEAKRFEEVALHQGIAKENILLEEESTNTGDNFRFSKKLLEKINFPIHSILIVHSASSSRRTFATAKALWKDISFQITYPKQTTEEFIQKLNSFESEKRHQEISLLVGDIQRLKLYPKLDWLLPQEIPSSVEQAYEALKDMGYTDYLYSKEEKKRLLEKQKIV